MKPLHFHAVAGHPKVAPPLMSQAAATLSVFDRFLSQTIKSAKQRQVRYQLPWAPVREQTTFRLDPVDTRYRVPRREPAAVLTSWSADTRYDLDQVGFVVNRGVVVQIEAATPTAHGLRVRSEPPLRDGDELTWCQRTSTVALEGAPQPPRAVADERGRRLALAAEARCEDDRWWLLVVADAGDAAPGGDRTLLVDGERVDAQALSPFEDLRRVIDADGRAFDAKTATASADALPADGLVTGDNGVRFRSTRVGGKGLRGAWVQLLLPEGDEADEAVDPRAVFCDGDVREVLTDMRRSAETTFAVKRVDGDGYRLLLDRLPPAGSILHLPLDLRNLYLQRRALRQLREAPLPHHQGLLRLCEDPDRVRWPEVTPPRVPTGGWRALTDATRSGTDEQRAFVETALGSPDFALLEGPPGSGKTTAICELVEQLVADGQRVLLCASTNVAIDNVLERLMASDAPIDAVRVGRLERVDDAVQATQLDARVEALVRDWRQQPALRGHGAAALQAMAERTVIMAANLTCGTTMGIGSHPLFAGLGQDRRITERPIADRPHWDVLIIDEASKTLIQEFMVPALMARRWVIVGDVRQLPPFSDRGGMEANLRELTDAKGQAVFPPEHQRACLLLARLTRREVRKTGARWLVVEPTAVLDHIARELAVEPADGLSVVRVARSPSHADGPVDVVTLADVRDGSPQALRLLAADWVLVPEDLMVQVSRSLPANLLSARDLTRGPAVVPDAAPLAMRRSWWRAHARPLDGRMRERGTTLDTPAALEAHTVDWLGRKDLAGEIAWRLTRLHELRRSRDDRQREGLRGDLAELTPRAVDIGDSLDAIRDIGLPSILEVLQEGVGADRSARRSALTLGLGSSRADRRALESRFHRLRFQHRMHPEIAAFAREQFYDGGALKDANTIAERDGNSGWDYGGDTPRMLWAHVAGREQGGVNADEVAVIRALLDVFIAWARESGPRGRVWEVACLAFYTKQVNALSEMLQDLTGDRSRKTRFRVADAPVEIVCGTVDRFQGREADLVALSMRNTRRVGFLNSPNRLNVALTRARQQLVVVGDADWFTRCQVSELGALALNTARVDCTPRASAPQNPKNPKKRKNR